MENNVHELKKAETKEVEQMPLNGYRITFVHGRYIDEDYEIYQHESVTYDEVEIFSISNGFVVIQAKGQNMVAYNVQEVKMVEQLPGKEAN